MSMKTTISRLDQLLKPIGFSRAKVTWNRGSGSVFDVIDVQVSKARDCLTINAGVLDPEVYTLVWGREPPKLIEQPSCTIGVRIGGLREDRKDKWWPLTDDRAPAEIVANVEAHVLPFLERTHTREAMKHWLIATEVTRKRYPLPKPISCGWLIANTATASS